MTPEEKQPPRSGDDRIEWFTVSYRTLALAGAALALIAVAGWLAYCRSSPPPPPPSSAAVETGARFAAIDGNVQVKQAGTLEWIGATKALVLRQNDLVRTGGGGTAEIHFADGTVFNVRPDSLITIEESSQNPVSRQQRVSLSIQSGEANFQTAARTVDSQTTISTPTVRATAERETAGNIQVAESGETGLRIFKGAGRAETRSGQRIDLASNEGVRVSATGAAGAKIALPNVPVLTAPPDKTEVAYPDPSRAITLLIWSAVPGATGYRVMVDFNPAFARPLLDRQGYRGTQMELRGYDTGTYYWKVAALDAGGAEGRFSDLWRFALARAPASTLLPPTLSVETLELKGNILHVRGRTEPGATLSLNGVRIDVQPDGSFNEFVTFEPGASAAVVLRATGVSGGVNEQRRPVVVTN